MSRPSVLHLGGFLSQRSWSHLLACILGKKSVFLTWSLYSWLNVALYFLVLAWLTTVLAWSLEVKHFLRQANHCFIGKIRPRLWGWTSKPALFSSLSLPLFWGRGEGRMNEQKTYFQTTWVDIADAYVKRMTKVSHMVTMRSCGDPTLCTIQL